MHLDEQLEQFKEMEDWFTRHLDKYGLAGDYTQAIYRKFCPTGPEKVQGGAGYLLVGHRKGKQRPEGDGKSTPPKISVYCEEARSVGGVQPLDIIRSAALTADQQQERTRALRFQRALSKIDPSATPPVLSAADVELASPAVLLWMAQVLEKTEPTLAKARRAPRLTSSGQHNGRERHS